MALDLEAAREGDPRADRRAARAHGRGGRGRDRRAHRGEDGRDLEELTIGKGYDPRDFSLLAFGGGGSLVASALAAALGIPMVIVPPSPATFSAWGMLTLDVVHDFARTSLANLADARPGRLRRPLRASWTSRRGPRSTARGSPAEQRMLLRSIDMRYEGQEHTLTIPLEAAFLGRRRPRPAAAGLRRAPLVVYGYSMADPVEVTAYRIRAVGSLDKPRKPSVDRGRRERPSTPSRDRAAPSTASRAASCDWAIYDRDLLQAGNRLRGPAIVEEAAATTLVAPRQELRVDELGNLVITSAEEG